MRQVIFDESGNTGTDLLHKEQQVFVLASCDLSIQESEELLSVVRTPQANELKFFKCRKSNAGKRRISNFIKASVQYKDRIKTTIFHKKYMVIANIVDFIIEPMAAKDGLDLYKDGANIAMSNVHFNYMPVFCGKELTLNMYSAFIEMVKNKSTTSIDKFYFAVKELYKASLNEDYKGLLLLILASEAEIHEILKDLNSNLLDPAITAFFTHCTKWGDEYGEEFDVLHDDSKPLFQAKRALELCMSKNIPHQIIGYDRRKFGFPLKANGVHFENSIHDPRVQVVDLIAGSTYYWANKLASGKTDDDFWNELNKLNLDQFVAHFLCPSSEVTPKKLRTDGGYGVNAIDHIAKTLYDIQLPTTQKTIKLM